VDHRDGEVAADPSEGLSYRTDQTSLGVGSKFGFDQMGQDLGVGVRFQVVAGQDQLVAELEVILDDPVVDQGQLAGAVDVGVGIGFGGATMGGPPGVTDTCG
jgi:hypothetical protein